MPPRERHLEFDGILRYKGVICDDTDGNSVHARMDKGSKWYAERHRELDYFHSVDGIRDRVDHIINSIGNINPSTATDQVRIAYGHECLDDMASKLKEQYECTYNELDWDEVYRRTWKYFKNCGFDKKYYKRRYNAGD